ncbi:hypothetical protein [Salinibacillus xinjiangensis]|uniref:Uncharacterized protein n=1 Tax=Salinibacillus xinjiangensis TaxID=1229268 RepID=A0A6G1X520_9BACI|nr:hypothetical protein [Salinibacillus xinjiangensis]MRG86037.1 hypothetical protein [Salinibacillus xinjiangensis]
MKRVLVFIFLVSMFFILGCNDSEISDYDDTDVAAIVRGEEITVGDLRFLYPDDKLFEFLDGTIKAKLAEQEVKNLNLDVSQELQEIQETKSIVGTYPAEDDDSEYANAAREFADAQSAKLGLDPEEYFEKHYEKTQETSVYVTAYIEEMLGKPKDIGEGYTEKANKLLDNLLEENEDEIQILIK